ncbi:MAG TPA: undecaprenyl-phosphate glucose phosphotransferase [Oleiagrimonas sp.]|nr:undecaprenyl-phosphate glucose phosphotransferase [Oleiagrimonas sp.]
MLLAPNAPNLTRSDTRFFSKYGALLDIALRAGDLVIVVAMACAVSWFRFGTVEPSRPYLTAAVLGVLLTLLIFPFAGVYRSWRGLGLAMEVARVCLAWSMVMAALLALSWVLKSSGDYSRLWVVSWYAGGLALFAAHRLVARQLLGYVRANGLDTRKVILVGATQSGMQIVEAARNNPWMGLDVVGYIATRHDVVEIQDLPRICSLHEFLGDIENIVFDQLWVALPMSAEEDIRKVMAETNDSTATIRLIPDLFGYELLNHEATAIAGIPIITLRGSPITGYAHIAKAIEDRVLSALILLFISPLMLLIALCVKLSSPGPVLYRQKRVGMEGKEFDMFKFRSMPVDTEKDGVRWGNAKNKQTTRFGRFIRKTSLDELPQFINVLKGDMSIVGPRPERPIFVQNFRKEVPKYMQKHLVKAGITGWAQINGWRGDTDLGKRIEFDLYYIRNWSVWMDIRIIFRTLLYGFFGKNAY